MPGAEAIAQTEGCQRFSHSDQLQILNWNKTPISSVNACIHELILQRCQQHPDRIAVSAWDGELTYEQLDRHSAALAHLLHEYSVGPEIFIPICFEKCRWTVVAILGILRAGAAFVLLDPSYPVQRLGEIYQEVAAPFLLSTVSCAKAASELSSKVIIIDGDRWTPSGAGIEPLVGNRSLVKPSNAAYAVFTSGTTGKPKGVVIEHAAFASMAIAQIERIPFTTQTRLLQFSSYAFDVSISDQLLSLMAGSCICVPSERDRQENLQGFINRHQVNCAFVTASVARLLSPDAVPSLQLLGLGGEKVARSDIETWSPHVRLLGEYGPAECSVTCAVNLDLARYIDAPGNIGFPLAARFWVTDPENAELLMPVGSPGELVVEGPTLARGYLNDPERTDAAFVRPDWLSSLRGERCRVYRTGDLVRYERDGSLVFLGRRDAQVKINGQRVELEDIEHHLRKCFPGALDVIAEVVSFGGGETSKLVAFVKESIDGEENQSLICDNTLFRLPTKNFQNRIAESEAALLRQLPRYMVPSLFFPVVHIPITTSGKANRRALQEMVVKIPSEQLAAYRGDEDAFSSPVNAMEEKLRRLWAKILRTSSSTIGRHSNWWRLGGDSLQAIRLVGELQTERLVITVREIFQHPVLEDMAAVLIKRETASSSAVTIPEPFELLGNDKTAWMRRMLAVSNDCGPTFDQIEDMYPCSGPQALIIQMSLQNMGNFTLLFEGELHPGLDRDRLVSAWDKVVQANPMLRTRLVPISSGGTDGDHHFLQVVLKQASVPVDSLDSRNGDYDGTFDLWGFNRPLIRLAMLEDRFLIMIHHVAYDLFSFAQMFAQLREAYEGRGLPYRPYSPFVRWERCSALGTVEFWKKTLAGFQGKKLFPPVLPSANYTPTINSQLDTQFPITIEASHHGTLASKLYLALAIAIFHELDNSDIIFGGSFIRRGAPVPGIMEMMGPTTCILPVRIQLDREDTLLHAQQKVAHRLMEMSEFEDIDTVRIGRLSPDATAACKLRTTVVIMQDEVLQGTSYFFARTWQHKNMGFPTALLLMCSVSSGSAVVQAMYDQNILRPAMVQQLLDRLAQAVQSIEEEPHTKIIDVVSAQHMV